MQQEFGIRDIYFQVIVHLRGMWRHRWHMVFVAWFICLPGWGAVSVMEDQYVARALVKIEDPRADITPYLDQDSTHADVTREARRVLNNLMSRGNLLRVVGETDLAFSITNDREKEDVLGTLRAQLSLVHTGSNVYKITHRHNLPNITRQVVDVLLDLLPMDSAQGVKAGQARIAQKFLGRQVTDYEEQVVEAERALREFMAKNLTYLPSKEGGYYDRVRKLVAQIDGDKTQLGELEKRRAEVRRQLDQIMNNGGSPSQEIDQRIEELKGRLQDLFDRHYIKSGQKLPLYTENHADVVQLRNSIELLEKRKFDIIQKMKDGAEDPSLWEMEANPVYRQLKMTISELDVELSSIRARIQGVEKRLQDLKGKESVLPVIENELLRLQSHLDMSRKKMRLMLVKEGAARTKGDMEEQLSKNVRFKILERPRVPHAPVGPDRPLFATIVLISGTLAGVAVALFFAVIRPVFDSPASLKRVLGLPVLGMVSMVDEGFGRRWMNSWLVFVLGFGGLFGAYSLVLVLAPSW